MMCRMVYPVLTVAGIFLSVCLECGTIAASEGKTGPEPDYATVKGRIVETYREAVPHLWGEVVPGVKTRLKTSDKVIALTLDACGSTRGMSFDHRLIDFLEREGVPATLFINARWIGPNLEAFRRLADNPLFEIANHGLKHKPASVNGKSVYGIDGTRTVSELVDEIELSNRELAAVTGRGARFYRSGTAYYDDVAVKVAGELGMTVAGFSVLGDQGATLSRDQVKRALLGARPGDIVIIHMNHPESGTAAGVIDAVPELKRRGFRFVRLSEYELQ